MSEKFLKTTGLFLLAWVALVVMINGFMYMSTDGIFGLRQAWQILPITALLCFFPALMMLADHLRPINRRN